MPDELKEIKTLISKHINDSNEFRIEMKADIREIRVHGEYTKDKLESCDNSIDELEKQNNKQKGAMYGLGALLSGGIIERIVDFFHK